MFAYIARQPIFDKALNIAAFELLFRDGEKNCFPDIEPDEATSKLLAGTHLGIGLEEIVGSKLAFINFHRDTLVHRFPTSLNAKQSVIEVVETVATDAELVAACKQLHQQGYQLALDDYDTSPRWQALLPYIAIIKFDIQELTLEQITPLLPALKQLKIKLVAEKIETMEEFECFKSLGFDYFQGYFLARPELVKHRKLGASKLTLLELLSITASPGFDLEAVNNVIQRDVSFTYLLLRFINNPMSNKKFEITSLKHALNYMGEVEIKKFIALMTLAKVSDDKPAALMQLSLVRAKFCELVSLDLNQANNPPSGFLTGLLSLLDVMMEMPMQALVDKIPLIELVKSALCGSPNIFRNCLQLAIAFEKGDWSSISTLSSSLKLSENDLHSHYHYAIRWATALEQSVKREE